LTNRSSTLDGVTETMRPPKEEAQDADPTVTEVAPGILRMQLPISIPGLGHTNCYAMEDDRGFTVVDPGLPGPASWTALADRLGQLDAEPRHIHTVVCTHSHPDHYGGAHQIREETGARVVTHRLFRNWWDPSDDGSETLDDGLSVDDNDAADAEQAASEAPDRGEQVRPDGRTPWGTVWERRRPPPEAASAMEGIDPRWFGAPVPSLRLDEAEMIKLGGREWVAVHTPGHTPDHLCLYDPEGGVMLSGDHVLPTITPHISGLSADADPLRRFMESLERMHHFDGVRIVLPAHGNPFTDLGGRADAIHRHHIERLETLRGISASLGPATVEALTQRLFRQRSWGTMAESETYAHLEHLRLDGEATRDEVGGFLHYTVG
jgi:glyoxylase-like metal-dependent hydrolase (beta-lactamase superfamily II)